MMKTIILYSTLGCHLCELAKEQLAPLLEECSLSLQEIDIADHANSEQLLCLYGVRIPVIQLANGDDSLPSNEQLDLGWPFDTNIARLWLVEQGVVSR
ncbi:glutaredoxin family protein [Eionea flava]